MSYLMAILEDRLRRACYTEIEDSFFGDPTREKVEKLMERKLEKLADEMIASVMKEED